MQRKLYSCIFAFASLWLVSCKQQINNVIIEVPVLRASAIYNSDSVDHYLEVYKDKNKELADNYFQKGKESETNNSDKAIFFIKRAITLYPCLNYYKELGAFSNKIEKYDEMRSAYNLLRTDLTATGVERMDSRNPHIDGQLSPDIIYEGLISYILNDGGIFYDYVDEDLYDDAKGMGITISTLKNKIFSDKRLKLDSNSEEYKDLYLNFLSNTELLSYMDRPSTFQFFIKTITDTSKSFEIDKDKVREFDYTNFNGSNGRHGAGPENMLISEYYEHYLPEKKKDTNWFNTIAYNYNHIIHLNDSILVIICAVDISEPACPVDMRQIYHRLITLTKNGRTIANAIVANQIGENLTTVTFNYNKYTVTSYKRYWEKPYSAKDFDNYLVKTEQTGKKSFQIDPSGKITEVSSPAGGVITP